MRRHLHFPICAVLLTAAWPVHSQVIDPKEPVARTLDASPADTLPQIVLDDQQRDVLRRHVERKPQPQTTGAGGEQRVAVGEAVLPAVSIERFPESVYDEAPTLRTLQ